MGTSRESTETRKTRQRGRDRPSRGIPVAGRSRACPVPGCPGPMVLACASCIHAGEEAARSRLIAERKGQQEVARLTAGVLEKAGAQMAALERDAARGRTHAAEAETDRRLIVANDATSRALWQRDEARVVLAAIERIIERVIEKDAPKMVTLSNGGTSNALEDRVGALIGMLHQARKDRDEALTQAKIDGPVFNSGRSEGRADVAVQLRAIVDPEDTGRPDLDGCIDRVRLMRDKLKQIVAVTKA